MNTKLDNQIESSVDPSEWFSINIDREFIKSQAENCMEIKITDQECLEVLYRLIDYDFIASFIEDVISRVIDFNRMMERNKDASKIIPHYDVRMSNKDPRMESSSIKSESFTNEDDVREYIQYYQLNLWQESNEPKIVLVSSDGEKEIEY